MRVEDFTCDLPTETNCDRCGRTISGLDWGVGPFGPRDWMGMCIVRCEKCSRVKVAAAGSSHEAHHRAQMMRWQLIASLGSSGRA